MPQPSVDLQVTRMAAAPTYRSTAGMSIRYDTWLGMFILIDPNAEEPRDRVAQLGALSEAVARLHNEFGLTDIQAREAVGRAVHSFGDEISLSYVVRTASVEAMGTPDQAPAYVDGIQEPFLRAYAKAMLAHASGNGARPPLQFGMTDRDAQDVVAVLQSFGIQIPEVPVHGEAPNLLASALERLASGAQANGDSEATVAIASEVFEEARRFAGLIRREIPEIPGAMEIMPTAARVQFARELDGMRQIMGALSARVRAGFAS